MLLENCEAVAAVMGVAQYLVEGVNAATLAKHSSKYASNSTASQFLQADDVPLDSLQLEYWAEIHLQATMTQITCFLSILNSRGW